MFIEQVFCALEVVLHIGNVQVNSGNFTHNYTKQSIKVIADKKTINLCINCIFLYIILYIFYIS